MRDQIKSVYIGTLVGIIGLSSIATTSGLEVKRVISKYKNIMTGVILLLVFGCNTVNLSKEEQKWIQIQKLLKESAGSYSDLQYDTQTETYTEGPLLGNGVIGGNCWRFTLEADVFL
ncbi:hypothetical protein OU798_03455 [Prolixibacteraceae bacterium Z1-6]|uniref:Uncharacterized protein n=1 Tax=Draconibacterium aestuarii TaxID=2998507 RepID=A0A9X3F5L4_9BACT|nr:hypothetical protein [Prolixibacteraceae bacterium Z1-6]